MASLLGLDIGTSSVKGVLISDDGEVLQIESEAYHPDYPQAGWSEQDPDVWYKATLRVMEKFSIPYEAIGLSGQMHGSVFLDSKGNSIRPALLWNDQRTMEATDALIRLSDEETILKETCNPLLTGFTAPKIEWLRANEPENYNRLCRVLLPKDYVRFRLTGEFATDYSDASGTGYLDVPHRRWSKNLLAAYGFDHLLQPKLHESWEITGKTQSGISVVAGAGDQAAGAVGVGAVKAGITSLSLGTSGVVFSSQDSPKNTSDGTTHTFCHANGKWHTMAVMLSCGGALQWLASIITENGSIQQLESLARVAKPKSEFITFLPYLAGERSPFVDPTARGALLGLSMNSRREDIAYAGYFGVSTNLVACLKKVADLVGEPHELRLTGGGATSEFWVGMIQQLTQLPCHRMQCDEGPAFGAALLAGVGIGIWKDVEEATQHCRLQTSS